MRLSQVPDRARAACLSKTVQGVFLTRMDHKLCLRSPTPRCRIAKTYGLYDCSPNHNSLRWFTDNQYMMEDHTQLGIHQSEAAQRKISNTLIADLLCSR